MNYQFPLLNLITRGHLQVKNSIAAKNFVEKLDNESCQTILENLIVINDSRLCARKFDEVMEAYNLKIGNRICVSESVLANSRDAILESDSEEKRISLSEALGINNVDDALDTVGAIDKLAYLKKLIMGGGVLLAIHKLAAMKPAERNRYISNLKSGSKGVYDILRKNPLFHKILPETDTAVRTGEGLWKMDLKNTLTDKDKKWYGDTMKGAAKGVGIAALIAGSLVAAVASISFAYKRWFSFAAKSCKGLNGKKRTICMCNAIISSSEKAMQKAEKGLLECDSAKDPQECRYKMKVEIRSWHKKIEEQKRKLIKLGKVNDSPYGNQSDTTDVKVSTNPFE